MSDILEHMCYIMSQSNFLSQYGWSEVNGRSCRRGQNLNMFGLMKWGVKLCPGMYSTKGNQDCKKGLLQKKALLGKKS